MTPVDRSRLPAVGTDPLFHFPAVMDHRLGSGLRVRTVEHRNVPVVTFALLVQGGSGADPRGREGLAAMTADMVDEGTATRSAIEVSDALARIGGEYGADTGPDAVTFTLTTLERTADRGAALLAEIVTAPALRQSDFDRVRQMRLDRLGQMQDLPTAVADRAFLRLLYGEHPYAHLSIGTHAGLAGMTLEDVARFHAAACRPDRSTLIVVGARPHAELRQLADHGFGGWSTAAPAAGQVVPTPEIRSGSAVTPPMPSGRRLVVVPRPGAAQSELRIGQISARRVSPDYPALLVMNSVLGGQFVSRINLKLREEKGFTYGARSGFDWRHGPAPFSAEASVHTAATAEAVGDALAELDAIRGARPPTDAEMALARASLTRGYPRGFETAPQVARAVTQLTLYGLPDGYFEAFVPTVNGVQAADVTAAAARHLDPATITTLIVGDLDAIGASLGSLGMGEPVVMDEAS